jgi:hypothetical protein
MLNVGIAKVMPEKQLSNTASRSRADQIATVGVFCQSVGTIIISFICSAFFVLQIQVLLCGYALSPMASYCRKIIPIDYFFPN